MIENIQRISLARPDLNDNDIQSVVSTLLSPRLSLGPRIDEFEKAISDLLGCRYAIAVNSGTAALHLCILACGIGPGDEVITTPFSFVASTNCILYVGATPVFADIEPDTWNIDPAKVEAAITPKTRAILPVHVFGRPCNMDRLMEIAHRHNLQLIEDSCEALGSRWKGRALGTFGNAGTFAFYPNKQITTGEGGMVVTDDPEIAVRCRSLRNQGRDEGSTWLQHARLGFNFRMSDIHAALGTSQLKRLSEFVAKRRQVVSWYREALQGFDAIIPPSEAEPAAEISWFVFVVSLRKEFEAQHRKVVLETLQRAGVECSNYFPPIHLQPYFEHACGKVGTYPVTESVAARTIALPFHTNLSREGVSRIAGVLKEAVATLEHQICVAVAH
jgi:perosamine synthetase